MGWVYSCCNCGGGSGTGLEQWEEAEDGALLPITDAQQDIGSTGRRVRSLHVSGNTIYIDGYPLTRNQDNRLVWDGNILAYGGLGALVEWEELSDGSLRPVNHNQQDIGDATHSIRNLFINGRAISVNDDGKLTIDDWPLLFAKPDMDGGNIPDNAWDTDADGGQVLDTGASPDITQEPGYRPPDGGNIQ